MATLFYALDEKRLKLVLMIKWRKVSLTESSNIQEKG